MRALLTYRSRDCFQRRFGRRPSTPAHQETSRNKIGDVEDVQGILLHMNQPKEYVKNDKDAMANAHHPIPRPDTNGFSNHTKPPLFAAQSYLHYQGRRFINRFDSNCYIALTRKLDTHDSCRGRSDTMGEALSLIQQPTLVLGIRSDILFPFSEQEEIAHYVSNARLEEIISDVGHDAFLIEIERVNQAISRFLLEVLPDLVIQPVIM
jgi:homoserine O-acetyltransferase/O-succinyltransferase